MGRQAKQRPDGGDRRSPTAASPAFARLGRRLCEAYDPVLDEPLPDRFANLLARLDRREREPPDDGA